MTRDYLLLCERCGVYEPVPHRPDLHEFSFEGPLKHTCGEPATMVKASHGQGTTINGRIVVFDHDLPER